MPYEGEERRRSHIDLAERLAVVESKLNSIDEIKGIVQELHTEITKYKGMVGAILWIGSSLGVLVIAFKDEFMKLFGK